GDGGEKHQPRGGAAIVLLAKGVLDEAGEILFELFQTRFAGEGLVVAEEGEDDVGPGVRQPFVRAAEALGAQANGQFVGSKAEVADDKVVPWEATLEVGFQPTVVLHAVGQRVADEADVVAGAKFEAGSRFLIGGAARN